MAKQRQGITPEELATYEKQCSDLARDWQRLWALIGQYRGPDAHSDALEIEFLGLRSTLSCDYPILAYWRKGGYGLSAGINRMMAGSPTLRSLAESAGPPESRTNQQWRAVDEALGKVTDALQNARRALSEGKPAELPAELLQHDTYVPFPVRKVLKGIAVIASVVLVAGTLYFMRNFLGFWAPEAGSGIAVTDSMTDAEKVEAALVAMARAFRDNDVDQLMAVVADDFRDDEGNKKTALRVALQAYKESGKFGSVTMDWSRIRITPQGDMLDVRPVYIVTPDERISIHLGFKPYRGKLLIATGSST